MSDQPYAKMTFYLDPEQARRIDQLKLELHEYGFERLDSSSLMRAILTMLEDSRRGANKRLIMSGLSHNLRVELDKRRGSDKRRNRRR
jgi:hypothetical protein